MVGTFSVVQICVKVGLIWESSEGSVLKWSYSAMEPKADLPGDLVTWNAGSWTRNWEKGDSAWETSALLDSFTSSRSFHHHLLLLDSSPSHSGMEKTSQEAADLLTALMWGLKCSCDKLAEELTPVSSVLAVTCLIRKAEMGNAVNVSPRLAIHSLKLLTFLFCLLTLTALDIGLLWFIREGKEGRHEGKEGFFLFTVLLFKQFQLSFEKHLPFRSIKWLQAKFPSVLNLCLLAGDNFLPGLFKKESVECDNSLLTWACMEAWKLWEPKSFSHSSVIYPVFQLCPQMWGHENWDTQVALYLLNKSQSR